MADPFSPEALKFYDAIGEGWKKNPASAPLTLPASSDLAFQNQRQAVDDNFFAQRAQQQYQRATARSAFANRLRDFNYTQDMQRARMPSEMMRRGMYGNSGVWRDQLNRFLQMRARALGDLQLQQTRTLGGFDVGQQTLERQRLMQLAEVEAQRQQLMAQLAARQFSGGGN